MYQIKIVSDALQWAPLDFPGVSMRVLSKDEATGSMTVLTRMEPGAMIPAHLHTQAHETVFVVSGDFVEDGETYQMGAFFAGAAGTPHGPHRTAAGCVVLTTFSAALDFKLV